jgi:cobyrinic acid a,c-diamide synthase
VTAPGLLIGAPRSGSGKTTVTLGIQRALRARGLGVRGVKCGPDYIDPAFHAAATGAPSCNLDSFAMPEALVAALAEEAATGSDIVVAEGSMGLFDGVRAAAGQTGASADIAAHLGWPVVLVVDVSGQAQSAAAVALGMRSYDPRITIAGVILNKVASERHLRLVREGMDRIGMTVFGALPREAGLILPERHLGLVQAGETADLNARLDRLGEAVAAHVDLDALLAAAVAAPPAATAPVGPPLPPPAGGWRWRATPPSPSSTPMWRPAGAPPVRTSSPSRRSPTRRRRRRATPAGCPAAIPSCTRRASLRPGVSGRACAPSPRHAPSMASAAATWCSARR